MDGLRGGARPSPWTRARPAARGRVGAARLQARDRWNTREIRVQELLDALDREGSRTLCPDEFQELLRSELVRSLNDGRPLDDAEVSFALRVAGLADDPRDRLQSVGFELVHDALRAWHAHRSLDHAALLLFAEFDLDPEAPLDPDALRELLTALNGHCPVPAEEVRRVAQQAESPETGRVERQDLLRAVCAWHTEVARAVTALPTIWREAALRTARDVDQATALNDGLRLLDGSQGAAAAGGRAGVPDSQEGATLLATIEEAGKASRLCGQASPQGGPRLAAARGAGKLCCVVLPFLLGGIVAMAGWRYQENDCPRNLDGLLLWFGWVMLVFCGLAHAPRNAWVLHVRISLAVIAALLSLVGLAWSFDGNVGSHVDACGKALVGASRAVWLAIPLSLAGYLLFICGGHTKRLRHVDRRLQREILA